MMAFLSNKNEVCFNSFQLPRSTVRILLVLLVMNAIVVVMTRHRQYGCQML